MAMSRAFPTSISDRSAAPLPLARCATDLLVQDVPMTYDTDAKRLRGRQLLKSHQLMPNL